MVYTNSHDAPKTKVLMAPKIFFQGLFATSPHNKYPATAPTALYHTLPQYHQSLSTPCHPTLTRSSYFVLLLAKPITAKTIWPL